MDVDVDEAGRDKQAGGVDDAVGRFVRHQVEPGSGGAVEGLLGGHAIRPSGTTGAESASMADRSAWVA